MWQTIKTLCDFYFPALVLTDDVVIGIGSGGESPGRVKEVRQRIGKAGRSVSRSIDQADIR